MQTPSPITDDSLITSAEAKRLAGGVSDMTLWRWQRAGVIPPPLQIRGRNYWRRGEYMRALEAAAQPWGDAPADEESVPPTAA